MVKPQPHEESTQSFAGKKGQRLTFAHRVFYYFKIDEIQPTDTLAGRGTKIEHVFLGVAHVFAAPLDHGILSADFASRWRKRATIGAQSLKPEAAPTFGVAAELIDISFVVEFLEDCEWSAKLIGRVRGKEDGDTREIARERAVRNYERDILRDNPAAADNPQFQDMIKRMLETP